MSIDFGEPLTLERLTEERLEEAAALSDQCVGTNMYPLSYLRTILHDPAHYFYLLRNPAGEAAGYYYFFLSDLAGMSAFSRLTPAQLAAISPKREPVIANLRSLGVAEAYRNRRIAVELMGLMMDEVEGKADAALAVAWKQGGVIPMKKIFDRYGLVYLTDAHNVWYDWPDLYCPVCKGRCTCDAAIFYKTLTSEGETP